MNIRDPNFNGTILSTAHIHFIKSMISDFCKNHDIFTGLIAHLSATSEIQIIQNSQVKKGELGKWTDHSVTVSIHNKQLIFQRNLVAAGDCCGDITLNIKIIHHWKILNDWFCPTSPALYLEWESPFSPASSVAINTVRPNNVKSLRTTKCCFLYT